MATALVSITFEAADLAAAQALIDGWTLHEGCSVNATLNAQLPASPGETDEAGKVREVVPPASPLPELEPEGAPDA